MNKQKKIKKQIEIIVKSKLDYSDTDYNFICNNIEESDFENNFYVLMFCIDWKELYEHNTRITLYDIIRKEEKFTIAYDGLKRMWTNGDLTDIDKTQEAVLNCVKGGLHNIGIQGYEETKGLYEFFRYLFQQILNTDYSTADDKVEPSYKEFSLSNKLLQYFLKLWNTYHLSRFLKRLLKTNVESEVIHFTKLFTFHILMRHYPATKLRYNLRTSNTNVKVRNIAGKETPQKAFIEDDGINTYSTDGTFKYSLINYYKFLPQSCILYVDMMRIASIIKQVVSIVQKAPNPSNTADIVYYDNNLYETSYDIIEEQSSISLIFKTIYPLNSKWQKMHGISKEAYNRIINKQDIPPTYKL